MELSEEEKNIKTYISEKSVKIEENNLKSIGKSIENERTRAGIIVGFYFLILINLFDKFLLLNSYFKGIIAIFVIIITILLINCFCSKKVNEGVDVNDNFEYSWKSKNDFFIKYYQILNNNKKEQKKLLSKLSFSVKLSIVLLSFVIFIILFFNSLNIKFMNENQQNSTKPEKYELNESIINTSTNSSEKNPMKPETSEKSE